MRVLVCGGVAFTDRDHLFAVLDEGMRVNGISLIISGMALGADTLAVEWAKERRVELAEFPADWKAHGRAGGPIRNRQMLVEGKPNIVVAFPGGRGTADMTSRAHKAGVDVFFAGKHEGRRCDYFLCGRR